MSTNNELRFGISALDIKHCKYAENDELLVRGSDGHMLYKRADDGQIVTYESNEYKDNELIDAINKVFLTHESVNTTSGDCLIYNTIDISGKTDILNPNKTDLNIQSSFNIDKVDSCVFIRIRGNSVTNSIASHLQNLYNGLYPDNTGEYVIFHFEILSKTTEGESVLHEIELPAKFNMLTPLYLPNDNTYESHQVFLKGVAFPLLTNSYSELSDEQKDTFSNLNYNNNKIEPDFVDIAYYTNDGKTPIIYNESDKISLQCIISASDINKDSFIVSSDKPDHKCIWAKIIE